MTTFLADINADTIPGSVALPTWVLIAAIVAVFVAREYERSKWFSKIEAATKALDGLTNTVEMLTTAIEARIKP
jgi:hypothetical protein